MLPFYKPAGLETGRTAQRGTAGARADKPRRMTGGRLGRRVNPALSAREVRSDGRWVNPGLVAAAAAVTASSSSIST